MKFEANVGTADLLVRVGLGLALVVLAYLNVIAAWGWLGAILIVTGIARYCPLYTLMGVGTCARDETKEAKP